MAIPFWQDYEIFYVPICYSIPNVWTMFALHKQTESIRSIRYALLRLRLLRPPRMLITRSSAVLTWRRRIDMPSLWAIPRPLTACWRIPPEMTAPRACSGIRAAAAAGGRFIADSRAVISLPSRLGPGSTFAFSRISIPPQSATVHPSSSHAPLKAPTMGDYIVNQSEAIAASNAVDSRCSFRAYGTPPSYSWSGRKFPAGISSDQLPVWFCVIRRDDRSYEDFYSVSSPLAMISPVRLPHRRWINR